MRKLFAYFAKEFRAIIQAPIILTGFAILMFALAYCLLSWRAVMISEQVVVRKGVSESGLTSRQPVANAFESLDPARLLSKSQIFVDELRQFIERYRGKDDAILAKRWEHRTSATEERRKGWNEFINEISKLSTERNLEYERRFKVDAMLLRDELRHRLNSYKPVNPFVDRLYQQPTNYFGFSDVANDIEAMSKLLVVPEKADEALPELESTENAVESE